MDQYTVLYKSHGNRHLILSLQVLHPTTLKAVLLLYINMEPRLSNEDCIIGSEEDLPVEILFTVEIIERRNTLFWLLHEYKPFQLPPVCR